MNDEKVILKCDECGAVLKTGIPDQDSRGYVWCRKCGLVYEPGHEMGHGLSGLIDFMNHDGLNDYVNDVRLIHNMSGLAKARLYVTKINRRY